MELKLIRDVFTDEWTEGKLYIDGIYFCDTLEDVDRNLTDSMDENEISKIKIFAKTAIPKGRYRIVIDYSNRFKRNLIHIMNVKGFQGIRIHSLNTADQSEGCVGVGVKLYDGFITKSRDTYSKLHKIVEETLKKEQVFITIE